MKVIIGEGWAALAAVSYLSGADESVVWISGSGSKLWAPLPASSQGVQAWRQLARLHQLGGANDSIESGEYLREFKGKAFRPAPWAHFSDLDSQEDAHAALEGLWEGDRPLARDYAQRLSQTTLWELEAELRQALEARIQSGQIRRIEGVPVQSIETLSAHPVQVRVTLADQSEWMTDQVIYADRWFSAQPLRSLFPQGDASAIAEMVRARSPMGILQARFQHRTPIGVGVQDGICAALTREPGETNERHIWGQFAHDGMSSVWSVCFSSEESENNHEIGKKFRRMKNLLEKMFSSEPWISGSSFQAELVDEQVRFEEAFLFCERDVMNAPYQIESLPGVLFLTDGYGPGAAALQAAEAVGLSLNESRNNDVWDSASRQDERMDLDRSPSA